MYWSQDWGFPNMEASGLVLALDFRKAVTVRFLSGTLFCSYSSNVTTSMWEDGPASCKNYFPTKRVLQFRLPLSPPSLFTLISCLYEILIFEEQTILFWSCSSSEVISSIKCLPAAKAHLLEMRCVLVIAVFHVSCCHRSCSFRSLRVLPVIPCTHSWGAQRCWTVAHSLSGSDRLCFGRASQQSNYW